MKEIITNNFSETQKLGEEYAQHFKAGGILCLEGELGAGKTTFTQGLLQGLGCEGPFTSPTFVLLKQYKRQATSDKRQEDQGVSPVSCLVSQNIYHIDAYRIDETNLADLGWEELIQDQKNIIIIEWPERIRGKIPMEAKWIKFEWVDQDKRKMIF